MRFLTAIFLAIISNFSLAQDQALVNSWGKGSRYLYIGVSNELKPSESAVRIFSASSKEASVSISPDSTSLIVKPRLHGPVTITLGMEQDSITLVYQSTNMPLPQISLGDSGYNLSSISKEQLAGALGLKISGDGKPSSSIYNECGIACYELQIGDAIYSYAGESFSDEMRAAFSQLPEGGKIIIKKLVLQVRSTGKNIRLDPATSFVVKN